MTRRFAWLLGLSLSVALGAVPAGAQDKSDKTPDAAPAPKSETPPALPLPMIAPTPVMEPITGVFAAPVVVRDRVRANVEVLQWWYSRDQIPSLLNTGNETSSTFVANPNGGLPFVPGTANDPTAVVLFGTKQFTFETVTGLRLDLAYGLANGLDLEYNGFLMNHGSRNDYFHGENGNPFLTRPFFNAHDIVESGYDTSSKFGFNGSPNAGISGDIVFHFENQFFGNEINAAWKPTLANPSALSKLLVGVRQLTLNERLIVGENVTTNQDGVLAFFPTTDPATGALISNYTPGQTIRIIDGFITRNTFYGPQFGAQWRWSRGPFSLDFLTKFAVGVDHETINVYGTTFLVDGGRVINSGPGGLLAVRTNSGQHSADQLTVVPEASLKLNFDLTCHIRLNVGYSFLYMSSVARPGTQIDRRINPELVPHDVAYNPGTSGPLMPVGFFRDTDFWAQGISLGLEVHY